MRTEVYSSDVTDEEWKILESLLPTVNYSRGGAPCTYEKRDIVNAIMYVTRSGCAWRMLPKDFPPFPIVFHYFTLWKQDGTWKRIHDALVVKVRRAAGRKAAPSAGILDSQTVKTSDQAGSRGYDAGKKIKGRKRHILVDTLGLIILMVVHAANVQDRDGAKLVLGPLETLHTQLEKIWADANYAGELEEWVEELRDDENKPLELEIVHRSNAQFEVLPHRWIVERSFGWMGKFRRLAKDYEIYPETSEAMIHVAMIKRMLQNLAQGKTSDEVI